MPPDDGLWPMPGVHWVAAPLIAVSFLYVLFHVHSVFVDVSFLNGSHTFTGEGEKFVRYFRMVERTEPHFCY